MYAPLLSNHIYPNSKMLLAKRACLILFCHPEQTSKPPAPQLQSRSKTQTSPLKRP